MRRGSATVLFLAVFLDLLGFGVVLPLLPLYAKEFATNAWVRESGLPVGLLVGLVLSSFSAMQFVFAPLWGRLSDRVGRRPVLLIGLGSSVVFYALFGLATTWKSIAWLLISRVGAGIAGATIPVAHAYVADTTLDEERAGGMALIGTAFGLGFTFGPLLGLLALPGNGGGAGPGPGFAAAALSALALVLAYLRLPESLQPDAAIERRATRHLGSLAGGAAAPVLALLLFASFLCAFAFSNFEATLSLLVKDEAGGFAFDFRELCLTFAFLGFVSAAVQGGVVRRVSVRVAERRLVVVGALVEVAGFLLLAYAGERGSSWLLFAALPVLVTGFAFLTPSLNALISRHADPAQQGAVMGVTQGFAALARILGPLAGIPLFLHVGTTSALWLGVACVALGLVAVGAARSKTGVDLRP